MIPLLLIWGIGSEHNGYLVNWRNWGHQDILLSGMPGLGWPLPFLPLTFGFVPTGSGFLDSSGNPMKAMPFLSLRTRGQLRCVWWSRCSTWPWALDGSRSRVPLAISGTTRGFQTQVFGWGDCGQAVVLSVQIIDPSTGDYKDFSLATPAKQTGACLCSKFWTSVLVWGWWKELLKSTSDAGLLHNGLPAPSQVKSCCLSFAEADPQPRTLPGILSLFLPHTLCVLTYNSPCPIRFLVSVILFLGLQLCIRHAAHL